MSRLTPGLITLDKGLDLNTAKIAAPEGTLLDSLNYEQVDFMGQKRIDGYVRYDGSLGSYQDDLYLVDVGADGAAQVGDIVFKEDTLVGVVVAFSDGLATIAVLDNNHVPTEGDVLSIGTVHSSVEARDVDVPQEQYERILDANQTIRERTTELPGPVAGLHWFNDRLYAVASVAKVPVVGNPYPNQTVNGRLVLKVVGGYMYLDGIVAGEEFSDMASLFQSRTEQQAFDELGDASLYGWDFVHQGWTVPFENGVSLYGDLAALNRNRKGVGVQGPTSTAGHNGKPLSVTQKVEIVNLPAQVNGWKTSDSRTTYNLNVNALDLEDNWSIYADAFFSWDGETGIVSSTGINSGALVEYSPNATVEVEV